MTDDLDFDLDLDADRSARQETDTAKIKIGGNIVILPPELAMEVLEPFLDVNADLSMLIRQALDAREASNDGMAVVNAVVDMIVVNPQLPQELIAACKEAVRRLVGDDGYGHLVAAKLSLAETKKIASFAFKKYGVSLGEASASSGSSEEEAASETSKPTSSGGTDSTPEASGSGRGKKAS